MFLWNNKTLHWIRERNLSWLNKKRMTLMPDCEFCGKHIVGTKWNKQYHHINICQKPIKRFFCSRQCKLKWIFENV